MPAEPQLAGGLATDVSRAGGAFATTHWSLVAHAVAGDTEASRAALEALCRTYWRPVYAFARRSGLGRHDAEDMTQGFIADLLARGALARADAARGRFRSFLLAAFKNYLSHQRARSGALKRGGGRVLLSLDELVEAEEALSCGAPDDLSPETHYDRTWSEQLIARVIEALRAEYERAGQVAVFAAARDVLWAGRGEVDYAGTAARLGMTEGALRVAVHRVRRRFGARLRAEIADTVTDADEIETEIRQLIAAFSG
jgi:RNA polymerase sigma-70 factor (ECF subfamily)